MTTPIFITGIGTGIGKTLVSAIVAEALGGDYWKPVQAGYADGTDSHFIIQSLSNSSSVVYPELYKLKMAASPHIAAREENTRIDPAAIKNKLDEMMTAPRYATKRLIIEGAGGIMVPLNEDEFVADLIRQLHAKVILVSRNYLGSINHSLLTAALCKSYQLEVLGWIFNDQYLAYEDEIVRWSGFPKIASIAFSDKPDKKFIKAQALLTEQALKKII